MSSRENKWIQAQRKYAEEYLRAQSVDHLGVGEYPAFHVHPYLALWAVQSKRSPGAIGWWVITGDLPADYISGNEARHPREALRLFARQWREVSSCMLGGKRDPDITIGTAEQWPEFGDLLGRRAKILQTYAENDEIWSND